MSADVRVVTEFIADDVVTPELAVATMNLAPANPLCTQSYADAKRAFGHQPWLLGLKCAGRLVAGCYAFLSSGALNRGLEISSLADMPWDEVFWNGLIRFCSVRRISCLQIDNRGTLGAAIPRWPGETERQREYEYVLDVGDREWERRVARHHWRAIRMAGQAGVEMRKATGADACREHVRLMASSMQRRVKRSEAISRGPQDPHLWCQLLTDTGAGELFQAVAGGRVLSSGLILRAAEGASYYSAGTSPEGMKCGASHFLIYSIARTLREESCSTFSMGSAEPDSGLGLFKTRFGATPVPFELVKFYLGNNLRRTLTHAVLFLRERTSGLLGRMGVESSHPAVSRWR
jgi:hypothetical protein